MSVPTPVTALATQYWRRMRELESTVGKLLRRIEELEEAVAEKDRIIALRDARIAELEQEVRTLKGRGKTLKEMIFKPEEKQEEEGRRGAKEGHRAFFRRKPTPEDITSRKSVELRRCPRCHETLGAPHSWRERYSIDIPPPRKPAITAWKLARYHCADCGRWVQGQPEGLSGKSPFGINLILKVLDMKYRGKDTDAYIRESLRRWHGIDLSDGGVHAILERAAALFGPFYESIKQAIREGKVVHADETGWRVEGENWHAWGFFTEEASLFRIEDTRGGGVATEALAGFSGVLVHDAYQGYNAVEDAEHQLCGVHFLRHTKELAEAPGATEEAREFHRRMTWFFRVARRKHRRCGTACERRSLHGQMTRSMERYWKDVVYADPAVEATRRWWLEDRGDQLLTFLRHETVPWDNNTAERGLRTVVRRRKITGGSRSQRGAQREAINLSCIQTLLQQGKDLFSEIPLLWRAGMASADS